MPNLTSVADEHVVLQYECLDRIFLNGYLPRLQTPSQLAWFFSSSIAARRSPATRSWGRSCGSLLSAADAFVEDHDIPVVHFQRRERKETVAARYFAKMTGEGVALVGVAQENANAFRPCCKRQRQAGKYSVTRATAFVKHLYFYRLDADWGPSFIKVCTYAPWGLRV